jgi:hypothetical protein
MDKVKYYLIPGDWRLPLKIVAMLVSWCLNKSVLWLIVHYLFGWIYLVYIILMGGFVDGGFKDIINYYFN